MPPILISSRSWLLENDTVIIGSTLLCAQVISLRLVTVEEELS